jgi:NTE family protein
MLFHIGGLIRLNEAGLLKDLKRVSSVSGGSIASGVLGLNWNKLKAEKFTPDALDSLVTTPLRRLASTTIDIDSIALGTIGSLFGDSVSAHVIKHYNDILFHHASLQDLPSDEEGPRFVFNATNMQTGALWRFMKPYMADYRVGQFLEPRLEIAQAVAASSAFPPVLSPVHIKPLTASTYSVENRGDLCVPPYTTDVLLTDGGVYDNLGLETAWKRYETVFVSDGGGKNGEEPTPPSDWARLSIRVFELTDNQVRSLRKRQIIDSIVPDFPLDEPLAPGQRRGAYWGIREELAKVDAHSPFAAPFDHTSALALTATRLASLPEKVQDQLINWGYVISDASIRAFYHHQLAAGVGIPYPNSPI